MRVSLSWIQEYLTKKPTAEMTIKALEKAGIEVEQINYSSRLNQLIVVAEVKHIAKHPNADKLLLIDVNDGKKLYQIVTGATNLKSGNKVPLAKIGAVLPNGAQIKTVKLRGEISDGMLCSADELELGPENDSILVLSSQLKLGAKLKDALEKDVTFNVTSAANRPDLLSVLGLAREIAAQLHLKIIQPPIHKLALTDQPSRWVEVKASNLAPRYLLQALRLKGKIPITPKWLATRLRTAGIRPINLIVDITNYCMLEVGQPLHAFDAQKVKLPIVVRQAKAKEKITTLDGVMRVLNSTDLVISDQKAAIALAGVMGGENSQINDTTTEILIESATFDSATIRKTALKLGLRSESSSRFERGLPLELSAIAMGRALQLFVELAKAELVGPIIEQLHAWPWVQHIGLKTVDLNRLAGTSIKESQVIANLQSLGFEVNRFNIVEEAKKHLGKPYKFGANFKVDGINAFDCSYLTDYLYSLIGIWIGHTALGQYEIGHKVSEQNLKSGDLVFYEGQIIKSATDHYYVKNHDGSYSKYNLKHNKKVGHNGIYIGNGKVITAAEYEFSNGGWQKLKQPGVIEVPLEAFTKNPGYLGARRYVNDLSGFIAITVPWWRPDVKTLEDILEEVIKVSGYEQVPSSLPIQKIIKFQPDYFWMQLNQIKTLLADLNLFEINSYSFISERQMLDLNQDPGKHLKLKNPRSEEQAYLRSDLLPSLLAAVVANEKYAHEFGCFEISRVFENLGRTRLPKEPMHLAVIAKSETQGYLKVKQVLDALVTVLNLDLNLEEQSLANFHPTRSALIKIANHKIGQIGEIHPDILISHKITGSLGYIELDFLTILGRIRPKQYQAINKFPSIWRDLAIIVNRQISWQEIKSLIKDSNLAQPSFLSEYYGDELPTGTKSVALRLEISSPERTLKENEAEKILTDLIKLLESKIQAQLR